MVATPILFALVGALAAPEGDSGSPATEPVAPPSGPTFELPGLDIDAADALRTPDATLPPAPTNAETPATTDVFEGRVSKSATLTERAAAIVDRTTLGGYGEHEFSAGESEISRFQNHRYILFIHSQINQRLSTSTELEFEFAGSPLKKDGILDAGEVLLEFSVVDFELAPWMVLRAGVILVPVGSFNLRHDSPTRDLVDRPIAYTTVVPTTWFESGVGVLGSAPLGDSQRLTWELYVINGLDARIYDGFGLRAARGSHFEDNNDDKAVTARVAWSPALGVELGLSGYSGSYDPHGNRVNMGNLDLFWRSGGFELLAEAVYVNIDPGFVEGFSPSSPANTRDAVPESMTGFFAQANYHFQPAALWEMLPDDLKASTLTAVLRYGGKDTDRSRHSAQGDQRRLTLGLNYRPIEACVLKFDAQWNSSGVDTKRNAADAWNNRFWRGRSLGFLADRIVTSVAYLF